MTAPTTVRISVSNIAEVIAQFDKMIIYRSTTEQTGPFVEVSTPTTRISFVAGTTSYTFIDENGSDDFWYQTSYFNTITLVESSRSTAVQGDTDQALTVISVAELKERFLFGVDLTNDAGEAFPNSFFESYIRSAVARVETEMDIRLTPLIIPEERQDFVIQDYYSYIYTKTDEYPIIDVSEFKIVLPTEQEVISFDLSWIHVEKLAGQINILPGLGSQSIALIGLSGSWLPLVHHGWNDQIPHVMRFAYTAGFEKGQVPHDIIELVGKIASIGPLHLAGDLVVGAGIAAQNISLDGIATGISTTQSATSSGYGARIVHYKREIKESIAYLRSYYKGIKMVVV